MPGQVRGRAAVLNHSLDTSGRPDSYGHLAFCQPRFKRCVDPGRRKLEVRTSVLLVTTYVGHVVKSGHMNKHPYPLSPDRVSLPGMPRQTTIDGEASPRGSLAALEAGGLGRGWGQG